MGYEGIVDSQAGYNAVAKPAFGVGAPEGADGSYIGSIVAALGS
jgi:hypothetical protein